MVGYGLRRKRRGSWYRRVALSRPLLLLSPFWFHCHVGRLDSESWKEWTIDRLANGRIEVCWVGAVRARHVPALAPTRANHLIYLSKDTETHLTIVANLERSSRWAASTAETMAPSSADKSHISSVTKNFRARLKKAAGPLEALTAITCRGFNGSSSNVGPPEEAALADGFCSSGREPGDGIPLEVVSLGTGISLCSRGIGLRGVDWDGVCACDVSSDFNDEICPPALSVDILKGTLTWDS